MLEIKENYLITVSCTNAACMYLNKSLYTLYATERNNIEHILECQKYAMQGYFENKKAGFI